MPAATGCPSCTPPPPTPDDSVGGGGEGGRPPLGRGSARRRPDRVTPVASARALQPLQRGCRHDGVRMPAACAAPHCPGLPLPCGSAPSQQIEDRIARCTHCLRAMLRGGLLARQAARRARVAVRTSGSAVGPGARAMGRGGVSRDTGSLVGTGPGACAAHAWRCFGARAGVGNASCANALRGPFRPPHLRQVRAADPWNLRGLAPRFRRRGWLPLCPYPALPRPLV